MTRQTGTGCLAQGPRPFGSVSQQRNRRLRRGSKTAQDTAQLQTLAIRLDRYAAEQLMLPAVVACFCKKDSNDRT